MKAVVATDENKNTILRGEGFTKCKGEFAVSVRARICVHHTHHKHIQTEERWEKKRGVRHPQPKLRADIEMIKNTQLFSHVPSISWRKDFFFTTTCVPGT